MGLISNQLDFLKVKKKVKMEMKKKVRPLEVETMSSKQGKLKIRQPLLLAKTAPRFNFMKIISIKILQKFLKISLKKTYPFLLTTKHLTTETNCQFSNLNT